MQYFKKMESKTEFDKYEVFKKFHQVPDMTLMSDKDHEFLFAMVEKYRPRKILEVGIARGGTSVLLLDWLNKLGLNDTQMYSVDCDTHPNCGQLLKMADGILPNMSRSKLYTGVIVPEVIEEIGDGIDFAIIDTFHLVPCEILDFLSCYPFLTKNAVVVLHDVAKNLRDCCQSEATKILYDVVTADKFWNWDGEEYPNIAGFQINNDTAKYILDIISALSLAWNYDPGDDWLEKYGSIIKNYYSDEAYALFTKICRKNQHYVKSRSGSVKRVIREILRMCTFGGKVYLYGAGKMTKALLNEWENANLIINGIIVSDGQECPVEIGGIKVYHFSEIKLNKESDIVINTLANWTMRNEVREFLNANGIHTTAIDLFNDDEQTELSALLFS